ncbi:Leucine Rich repeats (2 copies) [Stieleria varia]|uniref:Leucine Rich repeats (2 copies) n=1 Tax=Stieleria varia TaxID=2528005 RepID=A0A5C6B9F7_9BACT|nr:Leucine Rich repeats (2 copies) [Stieleria varia]
MRIELGLRFVLHRKTRFRQIRGMSPLKLSRICWTVCVLLIIVAILQHERAHLKESRSRAAIASRAAECKVSTAKITDGYGILWGIRFGSDSYTQKQVVDFLKFSSSSSQIEFISLSNVTLTESIVTSLAEFPNLRYLDVSETNIGDADLVVLARLDRLRTLDLRNSAVSNESIPTLVHWPSLVQVDLSNTRIDADGLQDLSRARPDVSILSRKDSTRQIKGVRGKSKGSGLFDWWVGVGTMVPERLRRGQTRDSGFGIRDSGFNRT